MLERVPVFRDLGAPVRDALLAQAERVEASAGEFIVREGDRPDALYILVNGRCMLSREMQPLGEAPAETALDLEAALGGAPQTLTAIATGPCQLLRWSVEDLWHVAAFAGAARRHLALRLLETRARLEELEAPVHYAGSAGILPGPFLFDRVTMLMAFCDADRDAVERLLPPGLRLLCRPGRARGSVFLALARFPLAYPEARPDQRFSYDETTCFLPVRCGRGFGLYVPYIYASAWEPILLGREIYGFPKRLGKTRIGDREAALHVDGGLYYRLRWRGAESSGEAQLVGALGSWIGFERRVTAAAFRAGEMLSSALRLPALRRVDVYNHKRILAPGATREQLTYDVDGLTRCVFGVLRWQRIERLTNPGLEAGSASPLIHANLVLREAFLAQLDMRLSIGRQVGSGRNF